MKKMTPVILVMLLLTSFFASMDMHELNEQMVIEDTSARAGADVSVVSISTPKETTCSGQGGCRNALQVGEEVTFSAYIRNIGDADINELTYTVKVYNTDSSQNVGDLAKDANGNDLVWENLDVMCDDGTICDYDSSVSPLAAGSFLGGGKVTLQRSGADIVWTPLKGEYIVEIEAQSPTDADTSNDAELVYVKVEDWFDVEVDLVWLVDDGNGGVTESDLSTLNANNLQSAPFKLIVTADGSDAFYPREVTIAIKTGGEVSTATLGTDDVKGESEMVVGTTQTVDVFANETDPNATQTASRSVLDYQTSWEMSGEIVPTSDSNAQFTISAELVKYTLYGQFEDCIEVSEPVEGDEDNVTQWNNECEVDFSSDDRPRTDSDELLGTKITYDDIRISNLAVYQGYNSDCTGAATTILTAGEQGDLNVGCSLVLAEIEHRGSDYSKAYGWNISYEISLDGVSVDTGTINECVVGVEAPTPYTPLGTLGPITSACFHTNLIPGEYTIDVVLNMNEKDSTDQDAQQWTGAVDQRPSNNGESMTARVVNNLPIITSFELETEGDIITGQGEALVFSTEAFDVDDPSGEGLTFSYASPSGEIGGCTATLLDGGTVCTTDAASLPIGDSPITVVVTDEHGGVASQEIDLFIWNSIVATATTDAGVGIEYALDYNGKSMFAIDTFTDGDITEYENQQLEGFTGTYSAVAVVNYAPSTTYTSNDILDQSVSVMVPKDVEATSLWYIDGSGKWILLSDMSTDVDATTEMFTYDVPANLPVLAAGPMVLMGGELAQASIPDASVSGFSAEATRGGAIAMSWDISGTMLSSDSLRICVSPGQALSLPDCPGAFNATVASEDRSYTYSGSQTTHGVTYHLEVAVCNDQGCSTPGIADVVADKEVDGDVMADDLTVAAVDGQWVVTWTVTGDASDVAMWHVCWSNDDFTTGEMPTPCPDAAMGGDATTVSIDMPAIRTGQEYFFTAVPMDALGNMDAAASMNSIIDTRVVDNSNTGDGTGTIGDTGDDASSSVPTWTWGLIGGVVIVAFIAGAFILSRGDGEGGEGKDWDY